MRFAVVLMIAAGTILASEAVRGGEKAARSGNVRKDAEPTANEYLTFWRSYFQGEWTSRVAQGEKTGRIGTGTKGTWSCQQFPP